MFNAQQTDLQTSAPDEFHYLLSFVVCFALNSCRTHSTPGSHQLCQPAAGRVVNTISTELQETTNSGDNSLLVRY